MTEEFKTREQVLEERLEHLLQSDFIASFDQVDYRTHEYVRDIRTADRLATRSNLVEALEALDPGVKGMTIALSDGRTVCMDIEDEEEV